MFNKFSNKLFKRFDISDFLDLRMLYTVIRNPSLYLTKLLINTMIVGLISYALYFLYTSLGATVSIPTTFHSILGLVIGLLLVFRTNTAYDRWWEGRKVICNLSSEIGKICIHLKSNDKWNESKKFRRDLITFMNKFKSHLINANDSIISNGFHKNNVQTMSSLMISLKQLKLSEYEIGDISHSINAIFGHISDLERIKDTPIPFAYAIHIKMAILLYILSLPFGVFIHMGLLSVMWVMMIYYIMGGINIISDEIEDPFAGEPNDLPVNKFFKTIINTLDDGVVEPKIPKLVL